MSQQQVCSYLTMNSLDSDQLKLFTGSQHIAVYQDLINCSLQYAEQMNV